MSNFKLYTIILFNDAKFSHGTLQISDLQCERVTGVKAVWCRT